MLNFHVSKRHHTLTMKTGNYKPGNKLSGNASQNAKQNGRNFYIDAKIYCTFFAEKQNNFI